MATKTMPATPTITVKVEGTENNQVKLHGALKEVNLAEMTCRIYTSASEYVTCHFDDELETDVIYALGTDVEVVGSVIEVRSNGNGFGMEGIRLQSITELSEFPPSAEGKRPLTGKDLMDSGVVGMWEGRHEDEDDVEFARRLRSEASPLQSLHETMRDDDDETGRANRQDLNTLEDLVSYARQLRSKGLFTEIMVEPNFEIQIMKASER